MKFPSYELVLITTLAILGVVSCDGETPVGDGPPFSALTPAPKGEDLFFLISDGPDCPEYEEDTCYELAGSTRVYSCESGGTVETDDNAPASWGHYQDCKVPLDDNDPQSLVTLNGSFTGTGGSMVGTLSINVIGSGAVGFAGDCELGLEGGGVHSGLCTFRDSEDSELTVTGERIAEINNS